MQQQAVKNPGISAGFFVACRSSPLYHQLKKLYPPLSFNQPVFIMPIAVELTLDDKTTNHLKALWREVQGLGLKNKTPRLSSTPHITLALYEDEHWDALVEHTGAFARQQALVSVKFGHIGMFNNKHKVLFMAPAVTPDLLGLRQTWLGLTSGMPELSKADGSSNGWVPHATLAKRLRAEQAQKTLAYLMQAHLPQGATITGVHLNQFTDPFASEFMLFKE